jgi:hypothetical protein
MSLGWSILAIVVFGAIAIVVYCRTEGDRVVRGAELLIEQMASERGHEWRDGE